MLSLGLGSAAAATTIHGNFSGTDVDFNGVQETSTYGDPEPLFGAPTVIGNQLLFFPTTFSASAAGGGFDETGAQLQAEILSTSALTTIDTILIDEFGDADLSGVGTAATGTFISLSGIVTVLETTAGPITPVQIGFTGTFSPSDLLSLPGDAGNTVWSGSAVIDVASTVPNATKVMLSLDNDLTAFSESGTTALIQKKVVDGPAIVITVIPEPATALLIGGGLLVLGLRARTRRA